MVDKNFRTCRGFANMPDDGGWSKVKFFFMNCCWINHFTTQNCLGNMYGLTQNGLMSVGRPTTCYETQYNDSMLIELAQGKSFGNAYLNFVNKNFPNYRSVTLALLGAGTLKMTVYRPYLDYSGDHTFTGDLDSTKQEYWIKNNVDIQNLSMVRPNTNYKPELKLNSGNGFHIMPTTHVGFGSKMILKIDKNLLKD